MTDDMKMPWLFLTLICAMLNYIFLTMISSPLLYSLSSALTSLQYSSGRAAKVCLWKYMFSRASQIMLPKK